MLPDLARPLRHAAARLEAATPASRDRAVDALRAFAVLGVVLGHWLVTALVADGASLHTVSPLHHMPFLAQHAGTARLGADDLSVRSRGGARHPGTQSPRNPRRAGPTDHTHR